MSRPKKTRKVLSIPSIAGFRAYGGIASSQKKKPVFLHCEEYEAFRLHDYKKYTQQEAAVYMQVSRPTFTRIYMSAREKIATAFVEGRPITIEGGKFQYDNEWYSCLKCKSIFNITEGIQHICPLCGSLKIREYTEEGS